MKKCVTGEKELLLNKHNSQARLGIILTCTKRHVSCLSKEMMPDPRVKGK